MPNFPVKVLWCGNSRFQRKNGWSFPPAVKKLLKKETQDRQVLQLFGGLADWGTRLDIDETTNPDYLGDAWLPPFRKNTFDVTIIDPPYVRFNLQEQRQLLQNAAYVTRDLLIWFHTIWIANTSFAKCEKAYLVRVGDSCLVRCLQFMRISRTKPAPVTYFERGPAMKYNRWLAQPNSLFSEMLPAPIANAKKIGRRGILAGVV